MKIKTETIDITPTWQGCLGILLVAWRDGTIEGQRIAKEEMLNMAKAADAYNKIMKERK